MLSLEGCEGLHVRIIHSNLNLMWSIKHLGPFWISLKSCHFFLTILSKPFVMLLKTFPKIWFEKQKWTPLVRSKRLYKLLGDHKAQLCPLSLSLFICGCSIRIGWRNSYDTKAIWSTATYCEEPARPVHIKSLSNAKKRLYLQGKRTQLQKPF